jgi:hypothetical protein
VEHGARGFGGIALSPMVGVQFEADVALVSTGGFQPEAAVSDQLPTGLEGRCELEPEARVFLLLGQEPLDERADILGCSLRPGVVA